MQLSLATKPPFAEFDLINRQMQLHNWDPANVIKVASSLSAQQKLGIIKLLSQRLSLFSFFFKKSPFPESKLWLLWGLNLRQATLVNHFQCSVSLLLTWTHSILALQRFTLPLGQRRGGGESMCGTTQAAMGLIILFTTIAMCETTSKYTCDTSFERNTCIFRTTVLLSLNLHCSYTEGDYYRV